MDEFNLADLRLPSDATTPARRVESSTVRKRKKEFVMVPMAWVDRLNGATGQTYRVALLLLHAGWKARSDTVKLGNGSLRRDGVSRQSKWRALSWLQQRGLVEVERRPNKAPLVRLLFQL